MNGNGTGAGGNGGPSGYGGKQSSSNNNFQSSGRAGWAGGGGRGGGLLNGSQSQGSMTLVNVTITGNVTGNGGTGGGGAGGTANTLGGGKGGIGGAGGGIWAQGAHYSYATDLTHVTISKNYLGGAGLGGGSASPSNNAGLGIRGVGAGIAVGNRYNPSGAGVYIRKSLISANGLSGTPNFDKNCSQQQPIANYQEFSDQGNNLSYPNDGSVCPGLTNVDPELGLLGKHGGPTETMVPNLGSAALGGVPLASCTVTTDQRGFPRPGPDGTSCDIGAVEGGAAPSKTATTMNLSSSSNPSKAGQQVTYTATVSPVPSSGTASFKDGGTTIPGCGAKPRNGSGQYTCTTTYATPGTHSIVASYEGNTLFEASSSNTLTQTVNKGTSPPAPKADIGKVKITGPAKVKKGKKAVFKVRVPNSGKAAAKGVKVKLRAGRLQVQKTIGTIAAGKAATSKFSIKLFRLGQTNVLAKVSSNNAGAGSDSTKVTVKR